MGEAERVFPYRSRLDWVPVLIVLGAITVLLPVSLYMIDLTRRPNPPDGFLGWLAAKEPLWWMTLVACGLGLLVFGVLAPILFVKVVVLGRSVRLGPDFISVPHQGPLRANVVIPFADISRLRVANSDLILEPIVLEIVHGTSTTLLPVKRLSKEDFAELYDVLQRELPDRWQ